MSKDNMYDCDLRQLEDLEKCKTIQEFWEHLFKYEFEPQIYDANSVRRNYLEKIVKKGDYLIEKIVTCDDCETVLRGKYFKFIDPKNHFEWNLCCFCTQKLLDSIRKEKSKTNKKARNND